MYMYIYMCILYCTTSDEHTRTVSWKILTDKPRSVVQCCYFTQQCYVCSLSFSASYCHVCSTGGMLEGARQEGGRGSVAVPTGKGRKRVKRLKSKMYTTEDGAMGEE